ncbi:MAG: VWA domain-containing protein [Proteiniphilum sp.]|jgi:Ca-activated chloride channel family protein|nr:VWA domain-containing protein [Proteiniphilum sp.]NCB25057.1 VWA domain-containing protein [Bacteroidia bacterium]MDD2937933.1 VWA domain-containing protein [Proteiniphilum sp.]MDD3075969.1 VWA domain-containing protein [Proteiniphilum sp.]MDD3778572.1 VWA domain-containing protein [Proteiniphilum sp.]
MFRFGNPEYLWLFTAMPLLLAAYIYLNIRKRKAVQKMGNLSTLKMMMPELSLKRSYLKFWLIFGALCTGIFMIARPQFGTKVETVEKEGIELVIAMDVSNSMLAKDVSPDRLSRAKQILSRLIDVRKNDKVALIVFAGEAYVQMPLTSDTQSAKIFLNTIDPSLVPIQGTAIGEAIRLGVSSFSSNEEISKAIVIITDGEDHEGDASEAAAEAAKIGVMVNVLGIGSPDGSPVPALEYGSNFMTDNEGNVVVSRLNEQMGMEIAQSGEGFYVRADNSNKAIRALETQLDELETGKSTSLSYSEYDEKFPLLAWILLVILLLEMLVYEKKNRLFRNVRLFK